MALPNFHSFYSYSDYNYCRHFVAKQYFFKFETYICLTVFLGNFPLYVFSTEKHYANVFLICIVAIGCIQSHLRA